MYDCLTGNPRGDVQMPSSQSCSNCSRHGLSDFKNKDSRDDRKQVVVLICCERILLVVALRIAKKMCHQE